MLLSRLKTVDRYTVMYHVLQVSCSTQFGRRVPGAKPLGKSGGGGAARPPDQGDGRGGGTVNGFLGMVPSRGMVKVGLILPAISN